MAHLYFTQSDLKLGISNGALVVRGPKGERKKSIPIASITDISVFGQPQISTQLVRECISRNIPIAYYSDDGHYFGHISSSQRIDPERQKRQIYLTDDADFCLAWSKMIISAKIANSIALLKSAPKRYTFSEQELHGLSHSLEHVSEAGTVEEALGFEGNAARNYFACLPKLLSNADFEFNGRSSRPPKDPFNSMLSFGYSLLYRDIVGAIERHGLHPYFAFMHKLHYGHAALASDLVEEYRAPLVDRTVLNIVNSRDVDASSFYENESGAIYMTRETSRALANRMSDAMSMGVCYFRVAGDDRRYGFQAMLDRKLDMLVKAVETHDVRYYVPFVWDVGKAE